MKHPKGFAQIVVLLIIIGILAVGSVAYFAGKSSVLKKEANNSNYNPTTQQNYVSQQQITASQTNTIPFQNQQQQTSCAPTDTPSITVTSPIMGANYTVDQSITIYWESCNVNTFTLSLVSGGKDFGEIKGYHALDIDVSRFQHGSFQWIASNPAQAFTKLGTNSYQIVADSDWPPVLMKSGTFIVHQ